MITIEVRGKPVAKGRPRHGNGRTWTPASTVKWERQARQEAAAMMIGIPPLQGPLICEVIVKLPIPRSFSKRKVADALAGTLLPTTRPDVDNYAKAALDACNTIVFNDDSQVVKLTVWKRYCLTPGVCIRVGEFICA